MVKVLSNSSDPARRTGAVRGFVQRAGQARRSIRTLGKNDPNTIVGDREMLLGFGTRATLTTALAGADNDLKFTAKNHDVGGNSVRVAFVNPGGTVGRSIVVAGNDVTVNLAVTAGAINGTETATSIAAAINADPAASAVVTAEVAPANSGAGVVTAMALTNLTGGAWTKTNQQGSGPSSALRRVLGRKESRQTANGTGVDQIPNRGANTTLKKR